MSAARTFLLAMLLATAACADWTGVREVQFEDPYIQALEADGQDGWLGRIGLLRQYARVDRAFQLEAEGQLDAAADQVAAYLEEFPEDVRVRAYYLSLLTRLDRPQDVAGQASRILEAEPAFVPALLARGRARAELGDPGAAVADLTAAARAPTIRPTDRADALADAARFALTHAEQLERQEDWTAAAAAYATALDLPLSDAQRVRALLGRSRAAATLGRTDEAREWLERAVAVRPGDPELRLEAAMLAEQAGDPGPAIDHLEVALDLGPSPEQRRTALERLARLHESAGRYAAAAARLEQLIAMGPTSDASARALHVRAGRLLEADGRPAAAASHLEAAAAQAPAGERAALLTRAAALYEEAGRYTEAVAVLRAAVSADPSESRRARLGRLLVRVGRHQEAVEPLERALEEPGEGRLNDAELTASRLAFAEAHEAAGRLDAAIGLYRQVAVGAPQRDPARVQALERLAALHARRGEHRQAADYMMVLHREADDPVGQWAERAGDSYAAAGAWADAAVAYRTAMAAGALSGADGARKLAVALFEAGSYEEAEAALRGIPVEERTLQDLRYLATLAREAGQPDRAAALYGRALEVAPSAADSADLYRSVGYLHLGRDDTAAVAALDRALALQPDAGVRLDMARAQLRLGRPAAALETLEATRPPPVDTAALARLDLLAEIHADRGDTTAIAAVLEQAADADPTAYRLNRLAFFHEATGDYEAAATAFERAYDVRPSALQASRVAYTYRRTGDEIRAATWFRRSIDAARTDGADSMEVDLDAVRREVAVLTDRLAVAAYVSVRGEDGAAATLPGGVAQAGIASQGGVELRVLPLVQVTPWGREVDVFGRLFWGFDDGLGIDADSYQAQLGVRYRPRLLPGAAMGLERWVAIGDAARDVWAARLQLSRLVGDPYPASDAGPAFFASLYGDAAYLFDDAGTYTLYGEARPGAAIPLTGTLALIPHGTVSAYRQSPGGIAQSYVEGGPGLGLRLRVPREGRYTKDFWSLQLMAQYRWGVFPDAWDAGGEGYDELVLMLVLQL